LRPIAMAPGDAARSCLALAVSLASAELRPLESLRADGASSVGAQRALEDNRGLHCGGVAGTKT